MQFLKLALLAFVLAVSTSAEEQKTRSLRGLLEGDENRKLDGGHEDESHKKHKKPKKHYQRPRYYDEEKCKKWVKAHQDKYSPHRKWQKGGHRGLQEAVDAFAGKAPDTVVESRRGGTDPMPYERNNSKDKGRDGMRDRGNYEWRDNNSKDKGRDGMRDRDNYEWRDNNSKDKGRDGMRDRDSYDKEWQKKEWKNKHPSRDHGWEKKWEKEWEIKHPSRDHYKGWENEWDQEWDNKHHYEWDYHYPEYCTYEDYQYWCQFKF